MATHGSEAARGGVDERIHINNENATLTGRDIGCYNTVSGHLTVVNNHGDDIEIPINIAKWLRSPSMNYKLIHDETCSLRTPHTIQWLFDMQIYKDWVEGVGEEHRNLQCIGMPGAGKTVLASAVIEDLKNRFSSGDAHAPRVVLYVYLKHDRQSVQTKKFVLANLLGQLIINQEHPSSAVLSVFKEYLHDLTLIPGPERTIKMLESEIPHGSISYVVVDALDEFSLEEPSLATELIKDLEKLNVKLLITSRYDISFMHGASKIKVFASTADIGMFIEQRISSCVRLEKFIARFPELRSEILNEVTAKSQGMFLIARFLMDWICGLLKLGEVKKALKNLPSGTDAMYELTMGRVGDQRDNLKRLAMSAIAWVLLAKRRLRAEELQHVLAFELQDGDGMVGDDDLYELEDIISACTGLIVFVDGYVQFVHFSAQEFLDKSCDKYFPDAKLGVMETCLRYLYSLALLIPDDLRYASDPDEKAKDYFHDYPFADYASSLWGLHASEVDGHKHLNVQLVDRFFSHPLSPYLVSDHPLFQYRHPYIERTKEMSAHAYKTLLFATFGLFSLLQECINRANDQDGRSITKVDLSLNTRDRGGKTPLFFATAHNHAKAVKLLLEEGADASAADNYGNTPLHKATSCGFIDIITVLLENGAAIEARNNNGESALSLAVSLNMLEMVKLILSHRSGADITNIRNEDDETLLHIAARCGNYEIATILLQEGVDINSYDGPPRKKLLFSVIW